MVGFRERRAASIVPGRAASSFLPLAFLAATGCAIPGRVPDRVPNVIVILTDDQGYGDLGCYGATDLHTPHLDRMAAEGMRFTDFYAAAPVCTPSRAALLTGSYPLDVGLPEVLFPDDDIGLSSRERTLPEVLRDRGYSTACVGKWHLGHLTPHLPTRHGFDEYVGAPYSHDMEPATNPRSAERGDPPLPWMVNEEVVEWGVSPEVLTLRSREACLEFLDRRHRRPFFLFVPLHMPHVPWHASPPFQGVTPRGVYGDVLAEIDEMVGAMLAKLDERGLSRDTLVLFTSDNGPAVGRENGGSAGPLRGGKSSTWEGGMRVPCLARWPGVIEPGSACVEPTSMLDLLPTFAHLADAEAPVRGEGGDITPLLLGRPAPALKGRAFYYFRKQRLDAVRVGRFKLHVVRRELEGEWVRQALYDLEADPGEQRNVGALYPAVVAELLRQARRFEAEQGTRRRAPGRVAMLKNLEEGACVPTSVGKQYRQM